MKEEYQITADYQEARYKAIKAVLESQLGIIIEDLVGKVVISQNGKKIATIEIESKY